MSKYMKQRFTSQEFGDHIGLILHSEWKLPKGLTANKAGFLLMNCEKADLILFHQELLKLNPRLANIEGSIHDVCYGAISKFTYEDIKFFCKKGSNIIKYNMKNQKRKEIITNKCGKYPEFVLCPKNLKLVEKHLKIKS